MWTSSALLAVLAVPHVVSAAMPVCVEQAVNSFENGGTCNLGDESCYCSSANKNVLLTDISQACAEDSNAQASADSYVQSFCASMSGGSGYSTKGAPSTTITPHGVSTIYPTSSPAGATSATAYPTLPGGVLPPLTNATTMVSAAASTGYPVSSPASGAGATTSVVVVSSGSASGSLPVETITSVASQTPVGTATSSPTGPAAGNDGSVVSPLGKSWAVGMVGAIAVAAML